MSSLQGSGRCEAIHWSWDIYPWNVIQQHCWVQPWCQHEGGGGTLSFNSLKSVRVIFRLWSVIVTSGKNFTYSIPQVRHTGWMNLRDDSCMQSCGALSHSWRSWSRLQIIVLGRIQAGWFLNLFKLYTFSCVMLFSRSTMFCMWYVVSNRINRIRLWTCPQTIRLYSTRLQSLLTERPYQYHITCAPLSNGGTIEIMSKNHNILIHVFWKGFGEVNKQPERQTPAAFTLDNLEGDWYVPGYLLGGASTTDPFWKQVKAICFWGLLNSEAPPNSAPPVLLRHPVLRLWLRRRCTCGRHVHGETIYAKHPVTAPPSKRWEGSGKPLSPKVVNHAHTTIQEQLQRIQF